MTSTSAHLRRALTGDPSGPRLTYYDHGTDERVELSTTTLANWVAKTTNLLVLECGLGPGSTISLHLPRHWITAVWVLAADALGAEINWEAQSRQSGGSVDVAVIGPDLVDNLPEADEVFAVSLAPLAAPFASPLPVLVRDFTVEARLMPDQVSVGLGPAEGSAGPAGRLGEIAERRAEALGLLATDRIASFGPLTGLNDVVDQWLAPLAAGASVVWVGNPDPVRCVSLWGSERVSSVAGTLPHGVSVPDSIRTLT